MTEYRQGPTLGSRLMKVSFEIELFCTMYVHCLSDWRHFLQMFPRDGEEQACQDLFLEEIVNMKSCEKYQSQGW